MLLKTGLFTALIAACVVNARTVIKDYTFTDITGKSHHFYGYLEKEQWLALFLAKPGN